jgi:hypothetical protein
MIPEVSGELLPTASDSIGLSLNKMSQSVIAGVDRGLSDVVGLFVLVADVLVSQMKCFATDERRNPLFEATHDWHGETNQKGFGNNMVSGGEVGSVLVPIDLIESLWKKLLSKFTK